VDLDELIITAFPGLLCAGNIDHVYVAATLCLGH